LDDTHTEQGLAMIHNSFNGSLKTLGKNGEMDTVLVFEEVV
jgi:hypothetical protein